MEIDMVQGMAKNTRWYQRRVGNRCVLIRYVVSPPGKDAAALHFMTPNANECLSTKPRTTFEKTLQVGCHAAAFFSSCGQQQNARSYSIAKHRPLGKQLLPRKVAVVYRRSLAIDNGKSKGVKRMRSRWHHLVPKADIRWVETRHVHSWVSQVNKFERCQRKKLTGACWFPVINRHFGLAVTGDRLAEHFSTLLSLLASLQFKLYLHGEGTHSLADRFASKDLVSSPVSIRFCTEQNAPNAIHGKCSGPTLSRKALMGQSYGEQTRASCFNRPKIPLCIEACLLAARFGFLQVFP